MIYRIRRIIEFTFAASVLMYAGLYVFKSHSYTVVMPYIFLTGALIYFIIELVDRQPKKPLVKMALLIVPLIMIAFSISIILSGSVSSPLLPFCLLAILMSSLQKRLSTFYQKS